MEALRPLDYEGLAQKAIEKNIGYFLRKLSRKGDLSEILSNQEIKEQREFGTTYNKYKRRWEARKNVNGKKKHIGTFKTAKEARKAFLNFVKTLNNG